MKFNGKKSGPIPNKEIFEFISKSLNSKYLHDEKILNNFLNIYFEWIQSSKLNNLHGLKKFKSLSICNLLLNIFSKS